MLPSVHDLAMAARDLLLIRFFIQETHFASL